MSKPLVKLDRYDYDVQPGEIIIRISGNTDPILVDILSEIEYSNGNIYVDGNYYIFTNYFILTNNEGKFLVLQVIDAN